MKDPPLPQWAEVSRAVAFWGCTLVWFLGAAHVAEQIYDRAFKLTWSRAVPCCPACKGPVEWCAHHDEFFCKDCDDCSYPGAGNG